MKDAPQGFLRSVFLYRGERLRACACVCDMLVRQSFFLYYIGLSDELILSVKGGGAVKRTAKLSSLICGEQGTRTGAIVSTIVGALSKPVGYLRTLMLAWLFGASAGMDAFYLSLGIFSLVCQIVQSVAESALLPRLVRFHDEGRARQLMAVSAAVCLAGAAAAGGLAWAFPESVVRFFARKFDAGRLNMASQMLRILVPWAAASIFLSLLGVWNVFRGRYSLNITLSCLGYASMIPMILAASRLWGVYSVAIVYSVMLVCLAATVWRVTGDFPLRSRGTALPPGTMRLVGRDTALCLGIVGASSLYQLVDRYFAAGLPEGNISAINYAGQIYMLPLGLLAPALMIYLNRASALAEEPETARRHLGAVMSMSWLYLFPPSLALAVLARPVVKLFLSYGAFGTDAVAMTAPCMSAAAWALPLLFWGQLLSRYARACGRLKTILAVSWGALFLNGLLDWAFVPFWGAPGLCAATGLTWGGSALVYSFLLVRGSLGGVIHDVGKASLLFSLPVSLLAMIEASPLVSILLGAVLLAVYFLLGEWAGLFNAVPEGWRPLALVKLMLSGAGRLRRSEGSEK